MNARHPCPDSALLAAFIDGMLVDYERTAVITHLADCGQCRAVATTVAEFNEVDALDDLWIAPPSRPAPVTLSTSRLRRWSAEKTRAPGLVMALAAAAVTLAIPLALFLPSSSSRPSVSTLVDASAGARPIGARLSGFAYAPRAASDRGERAPGRWQLVSAAGRLRDAYDDDLGVTSRQAVGVAALLVGQLDDAVASLSMAASQAPRDAGILNDLAAAYYERATTASRPDDLPRALSAVEKAVFENPGLREAWFNRALIIHALGLRAEARTAWHTYIERDPSSPWAREARTRVGQLGPVSSAAADWVALRGRLQAGGDQAAADIAVERHTSRTRDYVERELLKAWVATAHSPHDGDNVLERIRVLGDAFVRLAGDHVYADAVAAIARIRGNSAGMTRLVAAHQDYLDGVTLMAANRFADAVPVLARAQTDLAASGSPLALRARIETAAADYYGGRLEKAAAALPRIEAEARAGEYAHFVTRAAWLQGLVAFGRSHYDDARREYEEMLESAREAGDVDQWALAHVLLANLHWVLGDAPTTWNHRIEAAAMVEEVFSSSVPSAMFLGAAGDATASGNHAASLTFETGLLAVRSPNVVTELQVRAQRSRTFHHLGKQPEARAEVERVRELFTQVSDVQLRSRLEADVLTAEAEVLRVDERGRAVAAAERALTLPIVQRDQLRVARLHLLLAEARIVEGDVVEAERGIAQGIGALEAVQSQPNAEVRLGTSDPAWSLYVRGIQLALQRGDAARAFDYSERRRIRTAQERRTWGQKVLTLAEVQRRLSSESAVAILNQLDDQLQVWVIRRNDVMTYSAAITPAHAGGLIAAHLHEMTRATPTPAMSGELFDALLRPVSRSLEGIRNVVIVADAPYHRIAFAGLWDRVRNRYVIEDHSLAVAPSATAYAWALAHGRVPAAGARHASIFESPTGRPVFAAGAGAVNGRDHKLAGFYRAADVRRGAAATPAQLLAEVTEERDVVHVAASVVANDEFPVLSRLLLADEPGRKYSGSVTARHMADHDAVFRAKLVALETGVGQSTTPHAEGSLGFARTLLAAGVSNVVGPVAEVKASDLGQTWLDFHRYYASGSAAADSLRRAQLAALRESNHRPGPWAMVTVFGTTQ